MARVIYSPNPIDPRNGMQVKDFYRKVTVAEIIEELDIQEQCICLINGEYDENLLTSKEVEIWQTVSIAAVVEGDDTLKVIADVIQIGAIIVASFFSAGTAAYIIAGAALISTGIRSQIGQRNLTDVNGVTRAESPTYSLSAAGNSSRPYQGLPIVLGAHRIFPDYHSRSYEEYFTEAGSTTITQEFQDFDDNSTLFPVFYEPDLNQWVDYSTANFPGLSGFEFQQIAPHFLEGGILPGIQCSIPFQFCIDPRSAAAMLNFSTTNWSLERIPPANNIDYYGTYEFNDFSYAPDPGILTRAYVLVELKGGPAAGQIWYWQDVADSLENFFNINGSCPGANWDPNSNTLGLGPIELSEANRGFRLVDVTTTLEPGVFQIQHLFCFGYGDLDIEDRRFGNTNIRDLREVRISQPIKTPTSWQIAADHSSQLIVEDTVTSYSETGTNFGNNIDDTIHTNVDTVAGAQLINDPMSFAFPNNWLIREGPENVERIEVQISGRAFTINTTYLPLAFGIDVEYRIADSASAWTPFPGSPYTLSSIDSTVFNEEFEVTVPVNKYDVRVRIGTETPSDEQTETLEMSFKAVKFYQTDDFNYVGHNQEFVSVRATEQLNGQLDIYSAMVYLKCWDYDIATGTWIWRRTSNPASLFLYICLGGFINETKNGGSAFPDSPTIGWTTDHEQPDNGYRLFGGGIPLKRIDLDCLETWHQFCDVNNLEYNAVIDKDQTVSEVLHTIANIGRGSVQWSNSKIGVTYEDPDQIPVAMFTPYNILAGSFSVTYRNAELPEEIQVHYVNPDNDWTQDSVFAVRPDLLPGPVDKRITIDLFGCTNENQAQREANLIAAKQLYQRSSIQWQTDCEGLNVVRGDIVQLSHNLTCWDYSGRPIKMVSDGANITTIELDSEVCIDSGFIYVRQPNGNTVSLSADFDGRVISINDPWSIANAPGILDEEFTKNEGSLYPDCCQYDWLIMAGPQPTPGKRVRITSIDYKGDNDIEITATDEEPAYYANEFTPGFITPETLTSVKVRAFNACAIQKEDGTTSISFQLEGTFYAIIEYFIGSTGPFIANFEGQEVFGSSYDYCLDLPAGNISMTIKPILVGQAFEEESAELKFMVY